MYVFIVILCAMKPIISFEFVLQFVGCVTVTVSPNQIIIIIIIIISTLVGIRVLKKAYSFPFFLLFLNIIITRQLIWVTS